MRNHYTEINCAFTVLYTICSSLITVLATRARLYPHSIYFNDNLCLLFSVWTPFKSWISKNDRKRICLFVMRSLFADFYISNFNNSLDKELKFYPVFTPLRSIFPKSFFTLHLRHRGSTYTVQISRFWTKINNLEARIKLRMKIS